MPTITRLAISELAKRIRAELQELRLVPHENPTYTAADIVALMPDDPPHEVLREIPSLIGAGYLIEARTSGEAKRFMLRS